MAQQQPLNPRPHAAPEPKPRAFTGLLLLLVTAAIILLAGYQMQPPQPLPVNAPAESFSAERAMESLKVIARAPHPSGSEENARVRAYLEQQLQALGMETQTQSGTGIFSKSDAVLAGHAVNLMGRLKGTANTKAVMLVAHYDSVANGPGAADDGVGVVAILEAVRAVKAAGPLKNDLIVLFTDNEEGGLIGASAFVAEHPWVKEVGVLANLEARGINGPSLMFRTGGESSWLMREFAQAVKNPVAFSIFDALMKIIHNDTDMSAFRTANLSGFDHAFIGGLTGYHTMDDRPENVSLASLQHHGEYVLGVANHFGAIDLNKAPEPGNSVYFTLFGFVIRYPESWVLPIAGLLLVAFVGLLVTGLRRRVLTGKGLILGSLALLLSLIASVGVVLASFKVISALYSRSMLWPAYDGALYIWATVGLTIAIHAALSIWYRRRLSVPDLAAGALVWWVLLALATSAALPGASYLFVWPLFLGLAGLYVLLVAPTTESPRTTWLAAGLPLLGLLVIVPPVLLLFVLFDAANGAIAALFVLLALGLFPLHLERIARAGRWLLPAGGFATALLLLVVAGWRIDQHPERSMVQFFQNADTGEAYLIGFPAEKADSWTTQLFPDGHTDSYNELVGGSRTMTVLAEAQPALTAPAPKADLMGDKTEGGVRTLTLQITSPRKALVLNLAIKAENPLLAAAVDGRPVESPDLLRTGQFRFTGLTDAGVTLMLQVQAGTEITAVLTDEFTGLPTSISPKPDGVMAGPDRLADLTAIRKTFRF